MLVVVLFGLGFLGLMVSLLRRGSDWAEVRVGRSVNPSGLREQVLRDANTSDKVAVVDLQGVIAGDTLGRGVSSVELIRRQLAHIAEDGSVKAVILRVDSPGGEVLASDEIYRALREFQDSNSIPVVATLGSVAASGGYYVSAPCQWIVAHPLTMTGSIGVIFRGYNYRELMDKVGVRPKVVKSGRLKDMFSGDKRPEDELPEETEILEGLVSESFTRFKQVIRDGRAWSLAANAGTANPGRELAAEWENFADGRILSGGQALELGLVDELGTFDTALARALSLAEIDQARVIRYQMRPVWNDLFSLWGESRSGKVTVALEGWDLPSDLPSGRLYFISPLHVP